MDNPIIFINNCSTPRRITISNDIQIISSDEESNVPVKRPSLNVFAINKLRRERIRKIKGINKNLKENPPHYMRTNKEGFSISMNEEEEESEDYESSELDINVDFEAPIVLMSAYPPDYKKYFVDSIMKPKVFEEYVNSTAMGLNYILPHKKYLSLVQDINLSIAFSTGHNLGHRIRDYQRYVREINSKLLMNSKYSEKINIYPRVIYNIKDLNVDVPFHKTAKIQITLFVDHYQSHLYDVYFKAFENEYFEIAGICREHSANATTIDEDNKLADSFLTKYKNLIKINESGRCKHYYYIKNAFKFDDPPPANRLHKFISNLCIKKTELEMELEQQRENNFYDLNKIDNVFSLIFTPDAIYIITNDFTEILLKLRQTNKTLKDVKITDLPFFELIRPTFEKFKTEHNSKLILLCQNTTYFLPMKKRNQFLFMNYWLVKYILNITRSSKRYEDYNYYDPSVINGKGLTVFKAGCETLDKNFYNHEKSDKTFNILSNLQVIDV